METWSGHEVPRLPGCGQPLSLFDTARQGVYPVHTDGLATMYVCGITPYDAAHLGHAATMLTFDLINRAWRDAGHYVRYVQNVTDIDDPLLERANRDGEDWIVLGMRETALFREDMEALRIVPPDHYVGAVETIPAIVSKVQWLLANGFAYRMPDETGDVYFDLSKASRFGYESNMTRAQMLAVFAERGGDPDRESKKDALDPLLWRGARSGEPSWPGGELGDGRPGWHIECSVIAMDLLGDQITVQGGGNDLIFPHHEMSSAHAEALSGAVPFAQHYTHAGMIGLDGEKMSKSKGNLVFVSRLRGDGVDPMAIRLALLADHYHGDRVWTDAALKAGAERLALWRRAVTMPAKAGPPGVELVERVRAALADDLDTPLAFQLIDDWAERALAGDDSDGTAPEVVATAIDALLGVRL